MAKSERFRFVGILILRYASCVIVFLPSFNSFQIEFWHRTNVQTQLPIFQQIRDQSVAGGHGSDATVTVEIARDGNIQLNVLSQWESNGFRSKLCVNDGTWHHIALIRESTFCDC